MTDLTTILPGQLVCSIEGCTRAAKKRGWCRKHHDLARLVSYVERDEAGCWLWTGAFGAGGYSKMKMSGRTGPAHRAAYILLVGPIPTGMELDHLCRVRHCVNPEHLEPVTPRENTLRSDSPPSLNARKTECLRGHPFDEENTILRAGRRICRTCERARDRARWPKRRSA